MKHLGLLLFCAWAWSGTEVERVEKGNLVIEGIPEIPEELQKRMAMYQNTRSAFLADWHPSGEGILISTRFGETNQIHWVKHPGGARHQLTFASEPIRGGEVSPDPKRNGFLYTKDVGGTENYQVFFFELATGKSTMLSDGTSRNGGGSWANDGKHFAYTTTRRNGRDTDIHLGDITSNAPSVPILEDTGYWLAGSFSPNDSQLVVTRYISANKSQPYILNVKSGERTPIFAEGESGTMRAGTFTPDGKSIYFASNIEGEFSRLYHLDLTTRKRSLITGHINWDIWGCRLSDDGRYLALVANQDGIATLHIKDLVRKEWLKLPPMPIGQVLGLNFKPNSYQLGVTINSPKSAGDAYSLDLKTNKVTRWTYSEVGGLDTTRFIAPELIHYPTFDQVDGKPRMIPAFIYKPPGEGPFPAVINIHGGPEGQSLPFFSSSTQFMLLEMGIAVIQPNVRGSSGYGRSWLNLDNGLKREDSVKDIGALLNWIETQPYLDASRLVVSGGSYGGYMSLACMVHYNNRLRGGIDVVGISNFVTFLKNTKSYRRDLRRVEYGDERDPAMKEYLEKISPNNHAHKITKPMLIVQGLNDPRVPASESEQMVEVIRKNGGDVWYLLAKDEGHGFRKKGNRDFYQAAVNLFLQKVLLEKETDKEPEG